MRSPRARRRRVVALLAVLLVLAGLAPVAATAVPGSSGTVYLRTVPSLAGVHLLVAGVPVTTGADGTAVLPVSDLNGIASHVSLASPRLDARTTVSLAFVKPAAHSAPRESRLTVGLDESASVRLVVDQGATTVAPSTVQRVRLHSVTGTTLTVDPRSHPTVTLLARTTRLVANVATPQVVTWTVDSVAAAPGVTIAAARAAFDPLSSPTWTLQLQPVRGTVVVDTVPATPGVTFVLEGASFTTDSHGRGVTSVPDLNPVIGGLGLASPVAGSSRVSLLRVTSAGQSGARQRHVVAALAVSRPVAVSFVDPTGAPVALSRVDGLELTSSGTTVRVTGDELGGGLTLLAERATRVKNEWKPQALTYAVSKVTVDGAEAVFAGQQKFSTAKAKDWRITVSVFDLSVTVRDVLFGSTISSTADLTRPDGTSYPVELSSGPTTLSSLVRGEYVLTNHSAVIGANTRLLVSKSSHVEIRVVTRLDVAVLLGLALALCLSLLWMGRTWSRRGRAEGGAP